MTHFLRLLVALWLATLTGIPAQAEDIAAASRRLATENFGDIETGIAAVAESGSPRAAAILDALADQKLFYRAADKALFVKQGDAFVDAVTGAAVAEAPSGLKPVRVNNRVRRALDAAKGSLGLMSPDPKLRLQAAEAVFKSRDAKDQPQIEAALARESDPGVKRAFTEALAAIRALNAAAPVTQRLDAIEVLKTRGDQDALAILRAAATSGEVAVVGAASSAITAIERRLSLIETAQNFWYGLSLGSVLLLAAIGLAVTFGVMGVINMAHGEMVMLGAYTTFVVQEVFRARAPAWFDWSLPVAIPLAFLVAAFAGLIIERTVIRFLYGRPLETLLATFGVSLILQQAVRTAFGPTNREVGAPSYMAGSFDVFGLQIGAGRLFIVAGTLVLFAALLIALKATPLGLQMRAVTQNRRMAAAMGIRTARVDAATFALGSGIAGIAGVALSQIDNVSPNLGQSYIVDSFMVVVFGGVGNLWGTFFGAFTLGILNKFLEPFAGAVLGKILILIALILFIQKRPRGLFALKGRAVEA